MIFAITYTDLDGKPVRVELTDIEVVGSVFLGIVKAGRYEVGTLKLKEEAPKEPETVKRTNLDQSWPEPRTNGCGLCGRMDCRGGCFK